MISRRLTTGRALVAALAALPLTAMAIVAPAAAAPPTTPLAVAAAAPLPAPEERPRTIVTQDGEIDDMDSLVRLLYYSNEFDIEGIIYSSSVFHWRGEDPDAPADIVNSDGSLTGQCGGAFGAAKVTCLDPFRWTGTEWLDEYIDEYEAVYPNLVNHAEGYPTPEYLRSIYKIGNVDYSSAMTKDTDGSNHIKSILLDDDPRPVYVQTWGGLNTLARALKSIEEDYSTQSAAAYTAVQNKIYDKVVIYNILNQDDTLEDYIKPSWPGIPVIDNQGQFWSFAYAWDSTVPDEFKYTLEADWMTENLIRGHGELLDGYHTWGDGQAIAGELPGEDRWSTTTGQFPTSGREQYDFISEGDTPSFLYLLNSNGLRQMEDPTYGGWGGRFQKESEVHWLDTCDLEPDETVCPPTGGFIGSTYPQTRWVEDMQLDFAARADWGITPNFADANHIPQASVAEGVDLNLRAGQPFTLHGSATDPDGDTLTYRWWQYTDADTIDEAVTLSAANTADVSFTVPAEADAGDTIHLMLEVSDNGSPSLKHYQRVIVTVVDAFAPTLAAVDPASVSTTGISEFTIRGTDLFDVSSVTVGGTAADFTVAVDGRSLRVTAPASEAAGEAVVTITAGATVLNTGVNYVAPVVAASQPARGPTDGSTRVTLNGADLALVSGVTVGGTQATEVSAAADGTSVTFLAPPSRTVGAVNVVLQLPGADVSIAGGFVYARVAISIPSSAVDVGDRVRIGITGLAAGEMVDVGFDGDVLFSATADSAGAAEGSFTLGELEAGRYTVSADAELSGSATAELTVRAAVTTPSDLAQTGANVGLPLGLAVLALLAGGILLAIRRFRGRAEAAQD